jgi:predicted nucleic acid-binding protein
MIYADTSLFVSHYLEDAHSLEADRRIAQRPVVFLTPFHRAELANAVFRQVFRGSISTSEAQLAMKSFEQDCAVGVWAKVGLPEMAFEACADLARRLVGKLGVRTLDTLHVACALELRAQKFWTFDDRQARLADAVGLDTSA